MSLFYQGREPSNYLINSGGGGMRVVGDPTLTDHARPIYEAGISTVNGVGNAPDGNSTYRAFQAWSNHTSLRQDSLVVRILGTVTPYDRYLKPGDSLQTTRARRLGRWETQAVLNGLRGDTGNGFGQAGSLGSQQFAGDYPNAFIRVMSELTGFRFDQIETVQFL